ncbi:hypothetical protein GCM10023166_09280 [Paeniglutamicibacter cryotolerans]
MPRVSGTEPQAHELGLARSDGATNHLDRGENDDEEPKAQAGCLDSAIRV